MPKTSKKYSSPISINGRLYKIRVAAFIFNGERYTAEEASLDENLLKEILKVNGQRILKEIV
jgi:hypothetical protein